MFTGEYLLTIDGKGRVSIPGPFRGILERHAPASLIVTRDTGDCLSAYSVEEWRTVGEKVKSLLYMPQKEVRDTLRYLYSNAVECLLDRQGRILIPSPLREYASLAKEAILIGVDKKIEIWDAERWRRKKEVLAQHDGAIRDALAGLGF